MEQSNQPGSSGPTRAMDAMLLTDASNMDLDTLRRTIAEQQEGDLPAPPRAVLKHVPEVMDDFIRNFLLRNGMRRSLEMFEMEWYDKVGSRSNPNVPLVPDNYLETTALLNRVEALEQELRQHAELTTKATKQYMQARKERDFHRANHNRVVQERNKLQRQLKQANHHAEDINPTLVELQQRCDGLFKTKSLLTLERDRHEQRARSLEKRVEELEAQLKEGNNGAAASGTSATRAGKASGKPAGKKAASAKAGAKQEDPDGFRWPADERPRPAALVAAAAPASDPGTWQCQNAIVAHTMPVTDLALHPRKPAVASCSDDGTWRLSTLPQGDILVAGEGHKNWVASIAMHPRGTMVATGSGDRTVKLWDFASNSCLRTLTGHTDGVWSLDFQDESGAPLLASGALDQTARVWDLETGVCRQALRGHVDAVNSVQWQPFTNVLCTGSADKTVSLWDTRMNCCVQTLYGHQNAVLGVATTAGGAGEYLLASCDAQGVVMIWDKRTMVRHAAIECGPHPANDLSMDGTGCFIAVAGDDGLVRVIDIATGDVSELAGHEEAVQCVMFDPATNNALVSGGSDRTIRFWS